MIFSVPTEKGGYTYFEAPAKLPTQPFYASPKGSPIKGMFPPEAWDISVPSGARKTGEGKLPQGLIAVQRKGLSGLSDGFTAGSVAVASFVVGLLVGKALK